MSAPETAVGTTISLVSDDETLESRTTNIINVIDLGDDAKCSRCIATTVESEKNSACRLATILNAPEKRNSLRLHYLGACVHRLRLPRLPINESAHVPACSISSCAHSSPANSRVSRRHRPSCVHCRAAHRSSCVNLHQMKMQLKWMPVVYQPEELDC
ncbi:hypothetical protein AVEN_189828-1 [Araneus ventricosus]|uniref:Uncharacterized protein n=1 Tax=Araneus ventricosus TaxID=182803 RepID=A0A4Y2GEH9_ARAVE|nr:hypothetical protein AVEN_189828-1 [Araneus ventricosus]